MFGSWIMTHGTRNKDLLAIFGKTIYVETIKFGLIEVFELKLKRKFEVDFLKIGFKFHLCVVHYFNKKKSGGWGFIDVSVMWGYIFQKKCDLNTVMWNLVLSILSSFLIKLYEQYFTHF